MSFSTTEITDFRSTQVDSFNSVCSINRMAITQDSYGDIVKTPTVTTNVACGFQLTSTAKDNSGKIINADYDAVLRLAVSTPSIGLNDTITLTSHLGNTLNDTFEVYSVPTISTCMVIKLKRKSN